jgi:hypothetical protein
MRSTRLLFVKGKQTHAHTHTHRFTMTIPHINHVRLLDLHDTNLLLHVLKLDAHQGLGQGVCQLIARSYELNLNSSFGSTLTNEVITNLNVITSPMMNWVLDEMNCCLVVHLQQRSLHGYAQELC